MLINLNFAKRRWANDETFKGEVWIVNDLYESYNNLTAVYEITDEEGKILVSKNKPIAQVAESSSRMFFAIEESVLSKVKNSFRINLRLENENGKVVSTNTYLFLKGDQQIADAEMKRMGEERHQNIQKYTYGNYYMFYPKMNGEGKRVESKVDEVKAKGF